MKNQTILACAAAMVMLIASCSGSANANNDENEAAFDEIAGNVSATATAQALATPVPAATVTPVPTPTPEPTSTPSPEDLVQAEAEAIALEYNELTGEIFRDPRQSELTRVIELELPDSPLGDYGLRLTAELLEDNEYLAGEIIRELVGSDVLGANLIRVHICVQTEAVWRDLDTDEIAFESNPDPFITTIEVFTPTMQVMKLFEDGACTFADMEAS